MIQGGDFDGDGALDMVAVASATEVAVLLGDGSGAFAAPLLSSSVSPGADPAGRPSALAVADLNGDGALDVVATYESSVLGAAGELRVLLGMGDGTLWAIASQTVGVSPAAVAARDLDADGLVDVVVANRGVDPGNGPVDGSLSVLLGMGDGTFAAPGSIPVPGRRPGAVALADLDGDLAVDIALTDRRIFEGNVLVLRGNGRGGFVETGVAPVGPHPYAIRAADLNGDDTPDLLTVNRRVEIGDPDVSVLIGLGNGSFRDAIPVFKAGLVPGDGRFPELDAVELADVDGDGRLDLIGAGQEVTVLRGRGDGAFSSATLFETGVVRPFVIPDGLVVGDLDGDGAVDLTVSGTIGANGALSVLTSRGNGAFEAQILAVADPITANPSLSDLATGDFDRDGRSDLAVVDDALRNLTVLFGRGNGTLLPPLEVGAATGHVDVAVGDVDGDGRPDIVTTTGGSSGGVSVMLAAAGRSFRDPLRSPAGDFPDALALVDLNHDGRLDVATANSNDLGILLGNGDGTFAPAALLSAGGRPSDVVAADLDGDAHPDLVGCLRTGDPFSLLGRGDGTFDDPIVTPDGACVKLAAADLDGDALPDLVVLDGLEIRQPSTARVLIGRGDGTFEAGIPLQVAPGARPRSVVIARLDGDADLDIGIVNAGNDQVATFSNDGAGGFQTPRVTPVGRQPITLLATDFDGDGALDLAVGDDNGNSRIRVLLNLSN